MQPDPNHAYSHADEYQVMDYQHPEQFDMPASQYSPYPAQALHQHGPEQRAFFFHLSAG